MKVLVINATKKKLFCYKTWSKRVNKYDWISAYDFLPSNFLIDWSVGDTKCLKNQNVFIICMWSGKLKKLLDSKRSFNFELGTAICYSHSHCYHKRPQLQENRKISWHPSTSVPFWNLVLNFTVWLLRLSAPVY